MAAADLDLSRVTPTMCATFQAVALLLREQRAEATTAPMSPVQRAAQQKRIEGLAATLARTAARDTSLFALLAEGAPLLPGTSAALRELRASAGLPTEPDAPTVQAAGRLPGSSITREADDPSKSGYSGPSHKGRTGLTERPLSYRIAINQRRRRRDKAS